MHKFTMSSLLFSSLWLCASVSFAEDAASPTAETVKLAVQAAETARQQAAAVRYEWRDTADLLKQAQEALTKNDLSNAIQLANLAQLQADMAATQAEHEKTAGPRIQ